MIFILEWIRQGMWCGIAPVFQLQYYTNFNKTNFFTLYFLKKSGIGKHSIHCWQMTWSKPFYDVDYICSLKNTGCSIIEKK